MDEKKFLFDVENLKTDFAIENMPLSNQITINDMIEQIKNGEITL